MDIDDDDDLYQPEEPQVANDTPEVKAADTPDEKQPKDGDDELEEGEEEDEGAAMDEDDDDDDDSVRPHVDFVCVLSSLVDLGHRYHHRAERRVEA